MEPSPAQAAILVFKVVVVEFDYSFLYHNKHRSKSSCACLLCFQTILCRIVRIDFFFKAVDGVAPAPLATVHHLRQYTTTYISF